MKPNEDLSRALRVMLVHENGSWVAYGLEVAYVASGESAQEAMSRFVKELCLDIDEGRHSVLSVASPHEIWTRLMEAVKSGTVRLAGMSSLECRKPPSFPYDMALFFVVDELGARRGGPTRRHGLRRVARLGRWQLRRAEPAPRMRTQRARRRTAA